MAHPPRSNFKQNNRPPFRIKYWERPTIDKLARPNRELLERFFLSSTPFIPTDAEHIVQCELAGCGHQAVFSDGGHGWCGLCREVAHQQKEALMALGARRNRLRKAEGAS